MKIVLQFLSAITILVINLSARESSAAAERILVLGKGADGTTQELELNQREYQTRIGRLLRGTHSSMLAAFEERSESSLWKMKAIIVGLGIKIEFGVGPVIEVAAKPRYRLVYTKRGSKFYPDSL